MYVYTRAATPPKKSSQKKWEEWEDFFLIKDNVYTAILLIQLSVNHFSSVQPFLAYQKCIIIESIHLKH